MGVEREADPKRPRDLLAAQLFPLPEQLHYLQAVRVRERREDLRPALEIHLRCMFLFSLHHGTYLTSHRNASQTLEHTSDGLTIWGMGSIILAFVDGQRVRSGGCPRSGTWRRRVGIRRFLGRGGPFWWICGPRGARLAGWSVLSWTRSRARGRRASMSSNWTWTRTRR